jgi:hypothetical protein
MLRNGRVSFVQALQGQVLRGTYHKIQWLAYLFASAVVLVSLSYSPPVKEFLVSRSNLVWHTPASDMIVANRFHTSNRLPATFDERWDALTMNVSAPNATRGSYEECRGDCLQV